MVEAAEEADEDLLVGAEALHGRLEAHGDELLGRDQERAEREVELLAALFFERLLEADVVRLLVEVGDERGLGGRAREEPVDDEVLLKVLEHAFLALLVELGDVVARAALVDFPRPRPLALQNLEDEVLEVAVRVAKLLGDVVCGARWSRPMIRVAAAASPRFVSTKYPRLGRGVAAIHRRDIHAARDRTTPCRGGPPSTSCPPRAAPATASDTTR